MSGCYWGTRLNVGFVDGGDARPRPCHVGDLFDGASALRPAAREEPPTGGSRAVFVERGRISAIVPITLAQLAFHGGRGGVSSRWRQRSRMVLVVRVDRWPSVAEGWWRVTRIRLSLRLRRSCRICAAAVRQVAAGSARRAAASFSAHSAKRRGGLCQRACGRPSSPVSGVRSSGLRREAASLHESRGNFPRGDDSHSVRNLTASQRARPLPRVVGTKSPAGPEGLRRA